jgi:hypothetical protein
MPAALEVLLEFFAAVPAGFEFFALFLKRSADRDVDGRPFHGLTLGVTMAGTLAGRRDRVAFAAIARDAARGELAHQGVDLARELGLEPLYALKTWGAWAPNHRICSIKRLWMAYERCDRVVLVENR